MMEYQRLGDYIREMNVRNSELKVTKLVGLTIDKAFIPSVANVIGTDIQSTIAAVSIMETIFFIYSKLLS